ncbi:MAG: ATP-binding protein [Faecalicoccus sp.]|nr:ATP-binding protein [Faecalicoccus sp.]
MLKRTFLYMLALIAMVLFSTIGLVMGAFYTYFEEIYLQELVNDAEYLAIGVERDGVDYLKQLDHDSLRITWIAPDGQVLYDNQSDSESMENHLDRPEVSEALESQDGTSIRYSNTISQRTLYYAMRLHDGSVLRVSDNYISGSMLMLRYGKRIILVILIALVCTGYTAYVLSKRLVKPINEIDLDNPKKGLPYEELAPLATKIENQNEQIHRQIEDLQRQQHEFEIITNNMREGLIFVNNHKEVIFYNHSALDLLDESDISSIQSPIYQNVLDKALKGNASEIILDVDATNIQLFANPVYRDDVLTGAVVVLIDVTEKQQLNVMRQEFTANVTHELKTPLQSIIGCADLMANNLVKEEDRPRFQNMIKKEAQRLESLISDIISLSRVEEQKEIEKEPIELHVLCEDVLDSLSINAARKNISLHLEGDEIKLQSNHGILYEIIYNLCDNAIRYNKEAGSVTVRLENQPSQAVIVVTDTGIGIPKEHQDRIFERFYRVDKSHSKQTGGTGLGLSIVKHSVQALKGNIDLKSEPGSGTQITVKIPK